MRKFLIFIISMLYILPALADVRFIVQKGESYNGARELNTYTAGPADHDMEEKNTCADEGYKIITCEDGFYPSTPCPYNPYYYKECCPNDYIYSAQDCYDQKRPPVPIAVADIMLVTKATSSEHISPLDIYNSKALQGNMV